MDYVECARPEYADCPSKVLELLRKTIQVWLVQAFIFYLEMFQGRETLAQTSNRL